MIESQSFEPAPKSCLRSVEGADAPPSESLSELATREAIAELVNQQQKSRNAFGAGPLLLACPLLVEIDQVRDCHDVGSVSNSVLLLRLLKKRRREIVPPEL